MFRLAAEFGAQLRALCRDAGGAGVEMTLARHVAAERHQRGSSKSELFCAKQRSNNYVAAGAQTAIDAHTNTAAQAVAHQRLLRFGEAELPGSSSVLDAAQRRCARTPCMSG